MSLLKQLEKAAESHDDKAIVELYLAIIDASKVFKTHIATFFNQQSNLQDFDRYGKFLFPSSIDVLSLGSTFFIFGRPLCSKPFL